MPRGKHSNHRRGPAHPNYKGITFLSPQGYPRRWCPIAKATLEEHTIVLGNLGRIQSYYPLTKQGRPKVFRDGKRVKVEAHHFDGNRQNNCSCNIMWLERAIHLAIPHYANRDPQTGKWGEKGEEI